MRQRTSDAHHRHDGGRPSDGTLICYGKTTGITCSDTYAGHYFQVSWEGYELG